MNRISLAVPGIPYHSYKMAKEIKLDQIEHMFSAFGRLDEMKRSKQLCNFLIKIGSAEIHAHRNLLIANSNYFEAMLSHDTKENQTGLVEMKDVDPECVKICVDYIYSGKAFAPDDKYEQLMYVAHLMQLHKLCDGIASLLKENLDLNSFFMTKRIAIMYSCKMLEESCNEFMTENFWAISKQDEFGKLDKDFLLKIISAKNVKSSEDEKINAVLRWIKYDKARQKTALLLIESLSLHKVSTSYRRYLMENDSLISEDKELFKVFSLSMLDTFKVVPQDFTDPSIGGVILVFENISGRLKVFDTTENTWENRQKMIEEDINYCFSAVCVGDQIYVLMKNKSVYGLKYSDVTAIWERKADMLHEHGWCPPTAVLSGCIYVVAGHNSCNTDLIEKYDPAKNQWENLERKPQATRASEIIAFQEDIYSFGGCIASKWSKTALRFSPKSSTWTELSPMKYSRGYTSAIEFNDHIYVIGGYIGSNEGLAVVERYNPVSDEWATLKNMSVPRWMMQSHAIQGSIYVLGRNDSKECIEKFDIQQNTWQTVAFPSGVKMDIVGSVVVPK